MADVICKVCTVVNNGRCFGCVPHKVVNDAKTLEDELLADAAKKAKENATILAEAVGSKAGKAIFIQNYYNFAQPVAANYSLKSARSFASQGQQRSIVLSLKLSEGEVIRELFGEYPVFLFDDIFSELDSKRKEYVTKGIKKCQVIITSCESSGLEGFAGNVIEVNKGNYNKIK